MIAHQCLEVFTMKSGMYIGTVEIEDDNISFWKSLLFVGDEDPYIYGRYAIKHKHLAEIESKIGIFVNIKKYVVDLGQTAGAYGDNKPNESVLKLRVVSRKDKQNKNEFNFTYFNQKRADKINSLLKKHSGKINFELNDYLYRLCAVSFDFKNFDVTVL